MEHIIVSVHNGCKMDLGYETLRKAQNKTRNLKRDQDEKLIPKCELKIHYRFTKGEERR
jgi:hypothetical protein